jgi:hypothetical protein
MGFFKNPEQFTSNDLCVWSSLPECGGSVHHGSDPCMTWRNGRDRFMVWIWININERFVVLSMIAGNSSPYCVLTCGTQQSKTPIAQGKNSFYDLLY